jgi:hypothetical protein
MSGHQLLTGETHRPVRIRTDHGTALGDAVMYALVVPSEFRQVQAEYPILFRMNVERDGYHAFALLGFENGENLFLNGNRWEARHRPLAIDIQPFLIGGTAEEQGDKQIHIDMNHARIASDTDASVRVFDDTGRPTPFLESIAEKLGALDEGYREAAGFFAALREHDLIEPMTLEITLDDGSTNRLVGFHVVSESRLQALDGAALARLQEADHLLPIFMAVASLGRVGDLIARKNQRNAGG